MQRAEQVLGALLLLFAAYIGYQSSLIESGTEFGMGPAFLPFWLSVAVGIMSAALLVRAIFLPAERFEPRFFVKRTGALRVVLVLLGYLGGIAIMKPLGMPVSLAVITAATMPIFGARNWKMILLAAILTPLCVYVVFGRWLGVPLPMGVLEDVLPLY
jgi:putative tricarboxylic transport membrane protein